MKDHFLFFILLFLFSGCILLPPEDGPYRKSLRTDDNPFRNLSGVLTATNSFGISGVGLSNLTGGMEILTDAEAEPSVIVKLFDAAEGPGTDEISNLLVGNKDPFARELTAGFVGYSFNKTKTTNGVDYSAEELQRMIGARLTELARSRSDNDRRQFSRQELEKVISEARMEQMRSFLSNTTVILSNRYLWLQKDCAEYADLVQNGYRRSELENAMRLSLDEISSNFHAEGVTNLNQNGSGKSTLQDRKRFHDLFIQNAVSGDICVYFDPGDFLIGGHAFLWNGLKKKVLTSSLNALPAPSGCGYCDPDGSFPYLNHNEMWLLRSKKSYSVGAFENQMDAFESSHHLTGYMIQPFVYNTSSGTYCSQVVFLNWRSFDGRYVSSGAPLSWVPYTYKQHMYVWVQVGGLGYWQDYWVLQIGWFPVDTGFGIVTGNDILHDDDLKCVLECR